MADAIINDNHVNIEQSAVYADDASNGPLVGEPQPSQLLDNGTDDIVEPYTADDDEPQPQLAAVPSPPAVSAVPAYSYDSLFPALPDSAPTPAAAPRKTIRIEGSIVTQVFRVPFEERKIDSDKFGEGESIRTCQMIMKDTGAHIEISSAKDKSLSFLVSGKPSDVQDARRKILVHYQTQASKHINIPKEHHRWILGKKADNLHVIERNTATKISIPSISDDSDVITITGTKENIEKAEHEIRTISDEQSKKSKERVSVPKMYHPFVVGPFNEQLTRMMQQTGARINVPPPSVQQDVIVITGEKEGVTQAKAYIEAIHAELEKNCSHVCVQVPRHQHRYIFGSRGATIQEILQLTGVAVEMPSADSNNDTITLHGPHQKLGNALTLVYEKANSVVTVTIDAPAWIHKYIIGRKGVNINRLGADFPDVHVEFVDNILKIKGPPEQTETARSTLQAIVDEYLETYTFADMTVNPTHYKHIIGKGRTNVNRLKDELGVTVIFEEEEGLNRIHISGPKEGVRKATEELSEQVGKLENEKEQDVIIDHLWFSLLIGAKGENIRELRQNFSNVHIIFPAQNEKSDIVKLRGPKDDVDRCHKQLSGMVKEIQDSQNIIKVPIFKQFHKFIIGKGGANIKKIREETQTRIELPASGDNNEVIVISGKADKVEEARDLILKIQSELADIVTEELTIPPKFYHALIGVGGKLISSIIEECGGVSIKFPSNDSKSDKVTIRGPKEDVEKAKAQLLELSNERQLMTFTAEVRAKQSHHKFLIRRNGATVKKIRDSTGTRVVFPQLTDEDKEVITIIGKEENVLKAKEQLETIIREIDNVTDGEVSVDPKYHKHFVARRGKVLQAISEDFGGVMISFPRPGVDSDRVTLNGSKDCIELAKQRILDIVADLESQVTVEVIVPQRHHRSLMRSRGAKIQDITSRYDVLIKFPEREIHDEDHYQQQQQSAPAVDENGDPIPTEANGTATPDDESEPAVRPGDIIRITGNPETCRKVEEELLALIPVTEEVNVPFKFHRSIIGQRGQAVRDLMNRYDVHIELSPQNEQLDIIKISGTPANIAEAKIALEERVEELNGVEKDRELRSFTLTFEVDSKWHPKIIGRGGAVVNKIRENHGVQVRFPSREEEGNTITIQGYEEAALAAKADIMKIVDELDALVEDTLEIDSRVHSRIIGQRGRAIRKVMEDFAVDIKFPRDADRRANPDLVTIVGQAEAVADAKDHLLNLEEEYLQDVIDLAPAPKPSDFSAVLETAFNYNRASAAAAAGGDAAGDHEAVAPTGGKQSGGKKQGFVVSGAPWEQNSGNSNAKAPKNRKAPNTSSQQDFPSFGVPAAAPEPASITSAWGQRH